MSLRTVCKAMSSGFGVDPDRIELDDVLCLDWGFSGPETTKLINILGLKDVFGRTVTIRELVDAVGKVL